MIVYTIHSNGANKKIFVMPPVGSKNRVGDIEDFDTGVKKAEGWMPPSIKWFDDDDRDLNKYSDPDISYISDSSSLIVSPHTHDLIAFTVNDVAELLPVSFGNKTWYLLNVFNQVRALDKANSHYKIYSTGEVGWLISPAFLVDKLPHNKLFKIPENPARIYFSEHHPDDNENNFKFVKVWED